VEIALTTTTNHEFGNVKKCFEAGFSRVAVVATTPERLEQISAAVRAGLGPEQAANVGYYTPDALIAELRKLAAEFAKAEAPPQRTESTVRGYKVRRFGAAENEEERKAKETAAVNILTPLLKPKR